MLAKLYLEKVAKEAIRTRCILPRALVNYFKLPIELSPPDSIYPSKFSHHKVPCMQWKDGTLQEESIPIVLALVEIVPDKGGLLGDSGLVDRSQILQWMCKFNYDIMSPISTVFTMKAGRRDFDQALHDQSLNQVLKHSEYLDKYFAANRYLVGDKLTVADLYACTFFLRGFEWFLDNEWRESHPHLMEWWRRVAYHEMFDGFFKDLKFYETKL